MHPDNKMSKIVNGKRYSVATATLLASDEYWDGNNWERHGRNQFLYKTRGGAFFEVSLTQWQGERNTLLPLSREEAQELYEKLPEHPVDYATAFDAVVEEATAGRPPIYGESMRQTAIWLPEEMVAWLKTQPDTMSETIRDLIKRSMCDGG